MSKQNIDLVQFYFDAVARGDLEAAGNTFADDLVWHQPGGNSLSGTHRGKSAVFGLLSAFMERSAGSFRIDRVEHLFANGDLVAATIHFAAESGSKTMAMAGIDLLRVEAGKIAEVWLFSADQPAEDAFWG
ncbi:nuclear transport factor 2 family protein [Devosia ginsengisoli]|uniref:nuclear transport factor 2 family protein n=1 Tax=Devosia ginsengisoli TaxID=400770 RepID=UPI0026ED7D0D|nr:nuclear transport factor 2 family protein [Devosia ginsengisoli]MCR6673089.1 nuclear transport factor 2 family protein [Devosia ginsengisoli]